MWAGLVGLRTSKVFGWSCFTIALFLLLTAPLVLYDYYQAISAIGWSRWPLMVFGLFMRGLWIYIFFNRWLAVRNTSRETDIAAVMKGNRVV
jgi:hypothetical protein